MAGLLRKFWLHTGLSVREVVERHSKGDYVVFFLGFQPGFAYMGGLEAALHTPRRASPRLEVPAGSVGIGGEQTGIYPATSPGGWQLIGRTELPLFDPTRRPPTLLQPTLPTKARTAQIAVATVARLLTDFAARATQPK